MSFPTQSKHVLIGVESTWGTQTATPQDAGMIINDVTDNLTREVTESLGISQIETQKVSSGVVGGGLTMSGDYQHARMFRYILGSFTESTATDTTHTAVISDTPESLSIESGNNLTTDEALIHRGQLVESAELSIALNENLKLSVTLSGKSPQSVSSVNSSILSTLPVFPHALCTVKFNQIAATEVQSASITITKVVQRSGGISSNEYQQGHGTEMKFSFAATVGFETSAFNNLFLVGTAVTTTQTPTATADPGGITFELSASNGVASGSGQRSIKLILDNVISPTFDKITTIGSLTFIDMAGVGTFNSLVALDNISAL